MCFLDAGRAAFQNARHLSPCAAHLGDAMPSPLYWIAESKPIGRRSFLAVTSSLSVAALWSQRSFGAVTTQPKFSDYPFQLGVASGDPRPDSVVLWTRLAPRPLEVGGGAPAEP